MSIAIYHYPEHEDIKGALMDYADSLVPLYPFTQLKVQSLGWCSPKAEFGGNDKYSQSIRLPELFAIKDFFRAYLPPDEYKMFVWFNILETGGTIDRHNHSHADWVCVYHIDGEGDLYVDLGHEILGLPTVPGRMVIFPGTMDHFVPSVPRGARYSLAINAHKVKLP